MRPVYIIVILIVVIIVVSVVRISLKSSNHHFECPNCGEHFRPGFSKSFFTAHSLDGKYSMTCPKCHKTNLMPSIPGKE